MKSRARLGTPHPPTPTPHPARPSGEHRALSPPGAPPVDRRGIGAAPHPHPPDPAAAKLRIPRTAAQPAPAAQRSHTRRAAGDARCAAGTDPPAVLTLRGVRRQQDEQQGWAAERRHGAVRPGAAPAGGEEQEKDRQR